MAYQSQHSTLFLIIIPLLISRFDCQPVKNESEVDVSDLMASINANTRELGGVYKEYSSKSVSWDDGDRGTTEDGGLSVWGASITDTRLWAKDGRLLFTVRSDNWNEKLGHVKADEIKLVVGNDIPGGNLETITLKNFLKESGVYGGYAGLPPDTNLYDAELDDKVSIRFQTTFLPVDDEEKATLEVATEAYNYNTISDSDPKNIVVLATTQGIAVQQDGAGAKKLYHHEVDDSGQIHRYWLEAERTEHKVGGAQNETEEERMDAKKRGKALAREIGIEALGKRFNVLMTIQIPLKQVNSTILPPSFGGVIAYSFLAGGGEVDFDGEFQQRELPLTDELKEGTANAARLSRGSEVDVWDGLSVDSPVRHPEQHVTVTLVLYNTIAGGVPKIEDIKAAIDDMEALYAACNWSGNLIDAEANFVKSPLTNETLLGIESKIINQPYTFGSNETEEARSDEIMDSNAE